MPAPTSALKCRLHAILPEAETELVQIRDRILKVRIDDHSLRALGGKVDSVDADGDNAFEVATVCVGCGTHSFAGPSVLGTVVVMPSTIGARPVGLEGVGPAVHDQVEVIRHHTGGCI